jgi:hypothetical protein
MELVPSSIEGYEQVKRMVARSRLLNISVMDSTLLELNTIGMSCSTNNQEEILQLDLSRLTKECAEHHKSCLGMICDTYNRILPRNAMSEKR